MAVALTGVTAITACNYDVTYRDCELSCTGSGDCPDSYTCLAGVCRVGSATGMCGSSSGSSFTLRQTANDTIDMSEIFDCTNTDGTTAMQRWYRAFPPPAGVSGALNITQVNLGINFAKQITAVTVTIGAYGAATGTPTLDTTKFTVAGSTTAMIPATQITELAAIPIVGTISAGSNVYVEIDAPDLIGTSNQIAIGSTDSAQTLPAYVEAPTCGTTVPTSTTAAHLNMAAFVITMEGSS